MDLRGLAPQDIVNLMQLEQRNRGINLANRKFNAEEAARNAPIDLRPKSFSDLVTLWKLRQGGQEIPKLTNQQIVYGSLQEKLGRAPTQSELGKGMLDFTKATAEDRVGLYAQAVANARNNTKKTFWDSNAHAYTQISPNEVAKNPERYWDIKDPRVQELMPTANIKTMQQTAPHVLDLASQVMKDINNVGNLGPGASRWRNFWSGKVGAADPKFTRLRNDTNLLMTLLMKMHVGAKGSEYILKHFKEGIDSGKQSPENLMSAIQGIEDYANSITKPQYGMPGLSKEGNNSSNTGESSTTTSPNLQEYMQYWSAKYPNKTPDEIKAAYQRQYGGQ